MIKRKSKINGYDTRNLQSIIDETGTRRFEYTGLMHYKTIF